jgi:cell division septation protein DedD
MEMTMITLPQLNAELDALNKTMNDETDDSPKILAEQERLLTAIIAAEAADLLSLSAKALIAHFAKRAPGEPLAKGLSKAALIAKINSLPPLAAPEPEPTPEPTPAAAAEPETFSVAAYAAAHGLDGREIRKKLRAAGKRAPYALSDVEAVVKS